MRTVCLQAFDLAAAARRNAGTELQQVGVASLAHWLRRRPHRAWRRRTARRWRVLCTRRRTAWAEVVGIPHREAAARQEAAAVAGTQRPVAVAGVAPGLETKMAGSAHAASKNAVAPIKMKGLKALRFIETPAE